jgi:hypothetical protein
MESVPRVCVGLFYQNLVLKQYGNAKKNNKIVYFILRQEKNSLHNPTAKKRLECSSLHNPSPLEGSTGKASPASEQEGQSNKAVRCHLPERTASCAVRCRL